VSETCGECAAYTPSLSLQWGFCGAPGDPLEPSGWRIAHGERAIVAANEPSCYRFYSREAAEDAEGKAEGDRK